MIHSIKAKNFYSIGDGITLDFVAKEKGISSPELYLEAPLGKKVTKVAFVGGPNASGKTNVLRVIAFLRHIITGSKNSDTSDGLAYAKFVTSVNEPTKISVAFSVDSESIYQYDFILSAKQIIEETLFFESLITERSSTKLVFNRKWNIDQKAYDFEIADTLTSLKQATNFAEIINLPDNYRNSIALLGSIYDKTLAQIVDAWRQVSTNVTSVSGIETMMPIYALAERASRTMMNNEKLLHFASDFLRKADIGYAGIFESQPQGPEEKTFYGIEHQYGRNKFRFDPTLESTGTNRLLFLTALAAEALTAEKGGVAVIDEADAFLHPDIYEKFIELFMSPETNQNNTQLILSSHNYTTLNYLDKQQIFLTECDNHGQTDVWRLDEIDGVRADDNFYAKYMAGAYGAVPREDRA